MKKTTDLLLLLSTLAMTTSAMSMTTDGKTEATDATRLQKLISVHDHQIGKDVLKLMERGIPLSKTSQRVLNLTTINHKQFVYITNELKTSYDRTKYLAIIKANRYTFENVGAQNMSKIKTLLNLKQSRTNLDLVNTNFVALYNELVNKGYYKSNLAPLIDFIEDKTIASAKADENSLIALVKKTINGTIQISLKSLLKDRSNINDMPKEIGRIFNRIKNDDPTGNLVVSVDTRDLGDYEGDLTTFLKEMLEASVKLRIHPHATTPSMSMYELAEVAVYAAKDVKANRARRHKRSSTYTTYRHVQAVEIHSNWKAIVDLELKHNAILNVKKDSIKDSRFRIHNLRNPKVLTSEEDAAVNIDDILRDYEIYKRFSNLAENGAYLWITFPRGAESNFSDKEFMKLNALHDGIQLSARTYTYYKDDNSHTRLIFNSYTSIKERFAAVHPRFMKNYKSIRYYEQYLNCLIQFKDDYLKPSKTCSDRKQEGLILD